MAQLPRIDLGASLQQVRAGGLPQRAQQRLAGEAQRTHFFTSDLSVNEFLLLEESRARPIGQVMGSSVYHVGVVADYKGGGEQVYEITTLSQGHREARRRAISRLFQEAQMLNADAVVGVILDERMITMGKRGKSGDDGGEVIEFTAVGTAIRAPWITHPQGVPVVTDLTGQELWALAQDGFEPCGFLFDFCRYHVWHVLKNQARGGEVTLAQEAIDRARTTVEAHILEQAARFEAELVVGSDVSIDVHEVPCGYRSCPLNDLDVDISWFGTGIRKIPGWKPPEAPKAPALILSMTKLGRDRDELLEDAEDEIEEKAREAEEEAAEDEDDDE